MPRVMSRQAGRVNSHGGISRTGRRRGRVRTQNQKNLETDFTNHVVAKLATTLANPQSKVKGKLRVISASLAPCKSDRGKESIRLECCVCHKKQNYALRQPLAANMLLGRKLHLRTARPVWTQADLRSELKTIGIECRSCTSSGSEPPVPFTPVPVTSDSENEPKDEVRGETGPMRTVGQVVRALMPLLESIGTSQAALHGLSQQLNDDRVVDMDRLQDLEPLAKARLHKFSKVLKYHTDAYVRDQDDFCRDAARNKEMVKNNSIMLLKSSFPVSDDYKKLLKEPIKPWSKICETTPITQETMKPRPYNVEPGDGVTFRARAMFSLGDSTLRKVPLEEHIRFIPTDVVDGSVKLSSDPGKIAVHCPNDKKGFLYATAETRRYDEAMKAFDGDFPLESEVITATYSNILENQTYKALEKKWLATVLTSVELDALKQRARDLIVANSTNSHSTYGVGDETLLGNDMADLDEEWESDDDGESDFEEVSDSLDRREGYSTFVGAQVQERQDPDSDSAISHASTMQSDKEQTASSASPQWSALTSGDPFPHLVLSDEHQYMHADGQSLHEDSKESENELEYPNKRRKLAQKGSTSPSTLPNDSACESEDLGSVVHKQDESNKAGDAGDQQGDSDMAEECPSVLPSEYDDDDPWSPRAKELPLEDRNGRKYGNRASALASVMGKGMGL